MHIRKYVQEIERLKPDILVINDSPYVMAALPFISQKIIRIPVLHSALPWEADLGLSNQEWWDRVVAVSQSTAKGAALRGVGERTSVCLLGVPLPAGGSRHVGRPGKQGISIISVGRVIVQDKRMDRVPVIAKALAERKVDYHWRVLGDGQYLPTLRRELKELGLLERFDLPGSAAPSAVAEALSRADVFVLPSDSEGTPNALLEAMAHGAVPVVSRIDGSTTGIVEHLSNGCLCEPSDPTAFAGAIAELAANQAQLRAQGENAANTIARQFSLEAFTNRFLTIVSELRSRGVTRPDPLPLSQLRASQTPLRCLGFWRSVRTETLGRLKRWVQGRRGIRATQSGALLPSL